MYICVYIYIYLFIYLYIYLFIYFWLCWIFIVAHGLSLVVMSGGCSLVALHGLLIVVASLVAEHRLWGTGASGVAAYRFNSCGIGA